MDLTTSARAKTGLDLSATTDDTFLATLIAAVSALSESYLNRHAQQVARTEQYNVERGQRVVYLRGYPVDTTATLTFKNDTVRDFASVTAIDSDLYYLDSSRGVVYFEDGVLLPGDGVLQAVYTGGMATTAAAFITAFPAISDAVDAQIRFAFKRRDEVGMTNLSNEGVSLTFQTPPDLTDEVKAVLDRYKRMSQVVG